MSKMGTLGPELGSHEWESLFIWRLRQFEDMGIPRSDALTLAETKNVDWHDAKRLIEKGCPPALVFKILT